MRSPRGVSDGRVAVALSLSAGRCTTAENGGRCSAVRVLHDDPVTGDAGGLAMVLPSVWSGDEEKEGEHEKLAERRECVPTMLAVRTPLVTSEGGEVGALPYAVYAQVMAAHVAATLMRHEGTELLTVTHGVTESGKSMQMFGATVGGGGGGGGGGTNAGQLARGPESGLFASVMERIFAAAELEPCVAISVVEWRPSSSSSGLAGEGGAPKLSSGTDDSEDGDGTRSILDDGVAVEMEAIDLLSNTIDRDTPTGCFMEDYADIPAARYVHCEDTAEALAVLHTALRYSLAWQSVGDMLAQGPADVFELPDTRLEAEQRRRAAELGEGRRHEFLEGCSSMTEDDFLRPTAGSSSHVLVTLLLRCNHGNLNQSNTDGSCRGNGNGDDKTIASGEGCSTISIWRLWDLSGPSVWIDGGNLASRMAFATHTDLCQMAHRYMHRDQLQGGWWAADLPPQRIDEIIPLFSTQRQQQQGCIGIDKTATMIEAVMQHSCSSVLWIASLRCDSCYDDVNEEILEAAASLSSGGDGTNNKVITELRRRRRQENLDAAERVINMFALPFSRQLQLSQCTRLQYPAASTTTGKTSAAGATGSTSCTVISNVSVATNARTTTTIDVTPFIDSATPTSRQSSTSPGPAFNMCTLAAVDAATANIPDTKAAGQEMSTYAPVHASSAACMRSNTATTTTAAANVRVPPWKTFIDGDLCLEAPQHEGCFDMQFLLEEPRTDVLHERVNDASPLSPPSVLDTEHPGGASNERETPKDLHWDRVTDETGTSSVILFRDGENEQCNSDLGGVDGGSNCSCCCRRDEEQCVQKEWAGDLASIVQRLLEEPLARLEEISLHHEEELMRHHQRLIARLNALVCSDASTLEELQRRVRSVVMAAKGSSACGCGSGGRGKGISRTHKGEATRRQSRPDEGVLHAFGPCASVETSLERELSSCNNDGSICLSRFHGRQHRKDGAMATTRELIASERKIRFLERRLLSLERENTELRRQLSPYSVRGDKLGTLHGLQDVFSEILRRCSILYAEKATETDRIKRKYSDAMATLRALQQQQQQQQQEQQQQLQPKIEGIRADLNRVSMEFAEPHDQIARLLVDVTNQCNSDGDKIKNGGLKPHFCITGHASTRSPASSPSAHIWDVSAMHLQRVLMRATRFATAHVGSHQQETRVSPLESRQEQRQGDMLNCLALSIDRGSDPRPPAGEDNDTICTGLRIFREAAETAGDSALQTLDIARGALHEMSSLPRSVGAGWR